jgi:hypothetical protein
MGGEIMMIFEAGEAAKIKKLDWDKLTVGPKMPDLPSQDFWVDWKGNKLELGYTVVDSDWAQAISHELCKRFKVKKAGWDSVGFCKDIENFKKAKAFSGRLSLMQHSKAAKAFNALCGFTRLYKRAQKVYSEEAKRRLDLMVQ